MAVIYVYAFFLYQSISKCFEDLIFNNETGKVKNHPFITAGMYVNITSKIMKVFLFILLFMMRIIFRRWLDYFPKEQFCSLMVKVLVRIHSKKLKKLNKNIWFLLYYKRFKFYR